MQRANGKLVRRVFGTLVFAGLSFGASQAFADARWGWAAPGQDCFDYCTAKYGEGTQPIYDGYNGYQWHCGCLL